MSRFTKITWLWIAFILLGLAACGGGAPTTDPSLAFTQIWQTVEVAQAATALAASQTPIFTVTPAASLTPQVSNTPLLTSTLLPGAPSLTPISSLAPLGTQAGACDNSQFVTDVTIPDGTEVAAKSEIVKTWRVKNLGPCTWNKNYHLIFGWGGIGTNWNSNHPVPFPVTVIPGESLEITVDLDAPSAPGNYTAAFRLQNDKGYNFGDSLTIVISVK
ncbi:MAG: NBR1-Ig-like domain-containing protein [Anaerolineales bacterium]